MRDSYALYSDQLKGEYKDAFAQVETYVIAQNIDEDSREAHMGELLDAFLNAQEEGKPVEKIVGEDIENFCRNFCSEFTWENKAISFVDRWKTLAWVILIIESLDVLFIILGSLSEPNSIGKLLMTEAPFNLTGYLIGLMIVWGIDTIMAYITLKIMFKLEKGSVAAKAWKVFKVVVLIASVLIIFMMLRDDRLNFLHLPSVVLVAVAGLFLVVYYTINRKRVQARKEHKISFWGMVQEQVETDMPSEFAKEMRKQFEKKNQKLVKKGKPEKTWEEFLDDKEKETNQMEYFKYFYIGGPIVICLVMGIIEYLNAGFSTDFVIFIVILLLVECAIFGGFWKVEKSVLKTRRSWLAAERSRMAEITE